MQYYVVGGNGERYGPATVDELNQWAKEGRVNAYSMVVTDTSPNSVPLSSIPGFRNEIASIPPNSSYSQPGQYVRPTVSVPNHLVKSILATFFCCLPCGVVAIVFAAQVDGFARSGDIAQAEASSQKANLWSNISIGVSLVGYVAYGILIIGMAATGNLK